MKESLSINQIVYRLLQCRTVEGCATHPGGRRAHVCYTVRKASAFMRIVWKWADRFMYVFDLWWRSSLCSKRTFLEMMLILRLCCSLKGKDVGKHVGLLISIDRPPPHNLLHLLMSPEIKMFNLKSGPPASTEFAFAGPYVPVTGLGAVGAAAAEAWWRGLLNGASYVLGCTAGGLLGRRRSLWGRRVLKAELWMLSSVPPLWLSWSRVINYRLKLLSSDRGPGGRWRIINYDSG